MIRAFSRFSLNGSGLNTDRSQNSERAENLRTPEYRGHPHKLKTVLGGTIGNVMEWYDFALYGFFAPVLAQLFFPSGNKTASLIATFGVFAVGFVMRPIGGIIFGWIGDRFGRSAVLRISVIIMGAATFLLGVLPTAGAIGIWAAVLLLGVRLVQGLSVGGEFSGSVTYVVETSPLHRRGFSGSWANFGGLVGTLAGSGLAAFMASVLPSSDLQSWGWRVPFLLGGVFAVLAYLYIRRLKDVPHMVHHEAQHQQDSPLHKALVQNRRETLLAIVFASGYGICYYILLVYLPTYVHVVGTISDGTALLINSLGLALAIPFIPLFGWISDHFIRRRSLLLITFLLVAVLGWNLFYLSSGSLTGLVVSQIIFALIMAVPMGVAPAMFVELFPKEDRLTGYSVAFNIGLGIAGGTAPMIATWLISATGYDTAPGAYLVFAALISAAALWFMQDRSREPLR